MNNSYASWWIYIHYGEMLYLWKKKTHCTKGLFLRVSTTKSTFPGVRSTVGSYVPSPPDGDWFYWLPSAPIITQTWRPRPGEHVVGSRRQACRCRGTFYTLLAHVPRTQPLWEVLGGCGLFVASGDWSYSVWRDVTCSPTPHNGCTQTHTAHTRALSLCFSPGWSELFISLSTSAASREMLSLGHYKYPQAVENVLTDTGDKHGPACCCLSAAVW